jgi:hypothetical protein
MTNQGTLRGAIAMMKVAAMMMTGAVKFARVAK